MGPTLVFWLQKFMIFLSFHSIHTGLAWRSRPLAFATMTGTTIAPWSRSGLRGGLQPHRTAWRRSSANRATFGRFDEEIGWTSGWASGVESACALFRFEWLNQMWFKWWILRVECMVVKRSSEEKGGLIKSVRSQTIESFYWKLSGRKANAEHQRAHWNNLV